MRTTVESALSLARAREPGTEVVLVHDCVDRTTWVWLLQLKRAHPELHLIDFGEPYGNQLARLEGARRAHHSHVCFAGPGADPEALARAIQEAVPRSHAIAVLQEGLGASAEGRLVLQSFAPGVPVPVDGLASQVASQPAPRRRRIALLMSVGSICALAVAAVVGLRSQASPEAAASPGGHVSGSRAEIIADSTRTRATTAALERGETWPIDEPAAPKPVPAKPDKDAKPVKPRVTKASPAPVEAPSEPREEPLVAPAPDSSAGSSAAPSPSSESRPQKPPPAQNGQSSPPAEQSPPAEAPPAEPTPAGPDQAASGEVSQPLEGPVDEAAPPPPAAPAAPPAPPSAPPATPPATPPGTPPVDPGPGNGNGNGHAYGHANGNGHGNGNGNGPKK